MDSMYSVLVKMIPHIDPPAYKFSKNFDRLRFFQLFWQFAIVDGLFFGLVRNLSEGERASRIWKAL